MFIHSCGWLRLATAAPGSKMGRLGVAVHKWSESGGSFGGKGVYTRQPAARLALSVAIQKELGWQRRSEEVHGCDEGVDEGLEGQAVTRAAREVDVGHVIVRSQLHRQRYRTRR